MSDNEREMVMHLIRDMNSSMRQDIQELRRTVESSHVAIAKTISNHIAEVKEEHQKDSCRIDALMVWKDKVMVYGSILVALIVFISPIVQTFIKQKIGL